MVSRLPEIEDARAALWAHFASLCETLAGTRSKIKKREAIAEYLRPLDERNAGWAAQYLTGSAFPESDSRKLQMGGRMIGRVLSAITEASPERLHTAYRRYGDLGAVAEELLSIGDRRSRGLTMEQIAAGLDALALARTQAAKSAQFRDLLESLSPLEAKYLIKLLLGDMRIGVRQSLVEEAIAVAAKEDVAEVRRAETMLGDIPAVVALAWRHALAEARFRMFHSLGFMLATPTASAQEAFARFEGAMAQIEDKYDGMRAQIHCGDPEQPGRVRIFSRTREDVTGSFPELGEIFANVSTAAILDGEILAWDFSQQRARPFTALQQRLGRKRVTAGMLAEAPVIYMVFDLLLHGEDLLLDVPLQQRREALESWAAAQETETPGIWAGKGASQPSLFEAETSAEEEAVRDRARLKIAPAAALPSAEAIEAAFSNSQLRGNEGLMLKSLSSPYQPGRRGGAWIKLKRELATLDVVVTAVEYGHGRRAAVLSDYTFAVREGEALRNVGKAYSGLTDVEIADLTRWFLEHTLDERNGQVVVEPRIVLEVAFNNVMRGERHDSGYSLRFPRILRIRSDKPVEEIDTLDRVAEIFRSQGANQKS
jgi:DNA ligase-1